MNAMYLAYKPVQMLYTQTLNPTASATSVASSTSTVASKVKRNGHSIDELGTVPLNAKVMARQGSKDFLDPDRLWWVGVGMTAIGTALYYAF